MAAPAGYPYPPGPMPYMPAVIVKPETVSGIRTYQISLVLDIVFGVFALLIGSAAVLVTASSPSDAFSLISIIGASACGLVIVFVINFIVSLTAVMKMHHGADEYGADHARNATRGVLFKWLGTGLSTVATVLVVYLLISGTFFMVSGGGVPMAAYIPLLVTVFWTLGVTCKGQMYRHMIRALQPAELRFRTDLASLLIPALGIVGIGVIGFVTIRLVTILQNPGSFTSFEAAQMSQILIGGTFLPPGFALVGYVLLLMVYLRTSDRLSQGLAQVHAAMPVMPMWPPYPAPMPPPPAVAPPTTPAPPPPAAPAPASTPGPGGCPECGKPAAPGAEFCMNCGAHLRP
jgi:hypothetical protein